MTNRNNNGNGQPASSRDAFERRKLVIESVLETFKRVFPSKKLCRGKCYHLWIDTDDITLTGLAGGEPQSGIVLKDELDDRLEKNGYDCKIEIRQGRPTKGNPTPCVSVGPLDIEMYLSEPERIIDDPHIDVEKVTRARITLAPNSPGGLKEPEGYVIESAHAPYNIGRVIEPGDNLNRVNHIEVIDDTRRVSRTHAHIGYSQKYGFYIQCEYKQSGVNLTNRIRPCDAVPEIPLKSSNDMLRLQDDDIIELSGLVRLLFKIID